jgi:hypothetical protein
MRPAPDNSYGCVFVADWDDDIGGSPLAEQLGAAGVPAQRLDIPHLTGWAGCAYLLRYCSPKTGDDMVVLCVPHFVAADHGGAESYFYFPAVTFTAHPDEQWWIDAHAGLKEQL